MHRQGSWSDVPAAQLSQDLDVVARAETSLDIGRTPQAIYGWLTDFAHLPEWMPSYLEVGPLTPAPARPGARYRLVQTPELRWDRGPRTRWEPGVPVRRGELQVLALEPDRWVSWRTHLAADDATWPPGDTGWQITLEPVTPELTTVRLRGRIEAAPEVLLSEIQRLSGHGYPLDVFQRQADRAMHNLRAILEGRAGPRPP